MAIRQPQPVSPPLPEDKDNLLDFAAILQDNFRELFQVAHQHIIKTTIPASNEGNVGDIALVESNSTFAIYVKFPAGWKSVTVS